MLVLRFFMAVAVVPWMLQSLQHHLLNQKLSLFLNTSHLLSYHNCESIFFDAKNTQSHLTVPETIASRWCNGLTCKSKP